MAKLGARRSLVIGSLALALAGFWNGFLGSAAVALPAEIAVDIFEAFPPATRIFVEGPFLVRAPFKQPVSAGLHEVASSAGQVVIAPVKRRDRRPALTAKRFVLSAISPAGLPMRHHAGMLKRHYRGVVEISVRPDGKLRVRNILPVRDYVVAVVGSETFPGWRAEALKAQAVLTQTRLYRYKPNDVLGDTTQQEAYLGCDHDRAEVRSAVASVWGKLLAYGHRPIQPFYHSTCAGRTSAGDEVFGKRAKEMLYLASVECPYCQDSPFMKETQSKIPRRAFEKTFGPGTPSIATIDSAGRPMEITLGDGRALRGYDFWISVGKNFGWDKVPGTRFRIAGTKSEFVHFSSTGAGHGVGMCQWGAAKQARLGKSYRQILDYYFPGTAVE